MLIEPQASWFMTVIKIEMLFTVHIMFPEQAVL